MAQYLRPVSDDAVGGWHSGGGRTTNLYREIDETGTDDSNYVQGGTSSGIYKFALDSGTDPGSDTGFTIDYRARKVTTNSTLKLYLKQGSTTLDTTTRSLTSGSIAAFTWTLSDAVCASITNFTTLHIWLEVTAGSTDTVIVSKIGMNLPDSTTTSTGKIASGTLSTTAGTVSIATLSSGLIASGTLSTTAGTISFSAPGKTWRDIFTAYNPASNRFHVGIVDMTHGATAGSGSAAAVTVNHLVVGLDAPLAGQGPATLHRFLYQDSYVNALIPTVAWSSSAQGGAYLDRPESVVLGYWSYGAAPNLQGTNSTLLWEASIPYAEDSAPATNDYPYYGNSQPSEDAYFATGPLDFGQAGIHKTLSRITLWLVPVQGTGSSSTVAITVTCHPTNSAAGAPETVSETRTVTGYDITNSTPYRPVKMVWIDFDPADFPSGEAFEIKVKLSSGVGIRRMKVEALTGGDVELLDEQV